jgi:hypothetical protein
MTATLTKENIHRELVRSCVAGRLTEADALVWMVLLHTHTIRLQPGVVTGADPGLTEFPALTQRGAAAVVADLWADLKDRQDKCSDYTYWYHQYNSQVPYEVIEDVPDSLQPRLAELREGLARDSRVASVAPED